MGNTASEKDSGVAWLRLSLLVHPIIRGSMSGTLASPRSTQLPPASSWFPESAAFFIKCHSWGVASGYHPLSLAVDLGSRKAGKHQEP